METEGYMKDGQGRLVPVDLVKPVDKMRDELVKGIVAKSFELSKLLRSFKSSSLGDVKAFVSLSAEQYGVVWGGKKGNITLTSYDGEYRIIIAVDERITFDERLQAAKALIDECIKDWSDGANSKLKLLVDDAFAVDKAGRINTQRVLGLRRLDIQDEKWERAMDALSDSVQVLDSKEYIRIYKRNSRGEYDLVNLDVAA